MSVPDNLKRLHSGEETLRGKSIEAIEADKRLAAHAHIIERAMDLFDFFIRRHVAVDENEETIQLLGIRIFNGTASALKLLMSGYYQTSSLQGRDILETVFLLDYLQTDQAAISEWRTADEKTRLRKFSSVDIRIALDKRDGFEERKRAAAYKMFCELAGHATYKGFQMLGPQGLGAICGPFFESSSLEAVLSETARLAIQAGDVFTRFFPFNTIPAIEMKLNFMKSRANWLDEFYDKKFDRSDIDEMRALLAEAKDQ